MVRSKGEPTSDPEEGVLLTLTSRVARDPVRIDGVTYDMARLGDLSLNQRAQVVQAARRMGQLEKLLARRASADDEAEYAQRLRWLCGLALPHAPAEILERLPRDQQEVLVGAFFALFARSSRGGALATLLRGATPSSSSRASRRSTAAIRRAG